MSCVLSSQRPKTLATLGFPGRPLSSSSRPQPSASASQRAQAPFSDPSPMMNCLSSPVDRRRLGPASAATPNRASAPPPPLAWACAAAPAPARPRALVPSGFPWKPGQPATSTSDLPAGAGARPPRLRAGNGGLSVRAVTFDASPRRAGCRYCGSRKEKKKKFKDSKSPLLLFSWTGKASEIGKFEFSFYKF